jgi:tetratricopeptide (TPR) repeat protein
MKNTMLAKIIYGICVVLVISGIAYADWDKGVACFKAKDYSCAEQQFKETIKLNPENYAGYYMLGSTYFEMKRIDDAEKYFGQAIKYNSQDFGSNYKLAVIYMQKNKAAEAIKLIDQGITKAPQDTDKAFALRLRGAACFQLKKYDRASADINEAIKLLPNDETTQYLAGVLALQQKDYKAAFEYLNKSYSAKPLNAEHGLLLMEAAIGIKQYVRAKEVGEALVQKEPGNKRVLEELGRTYLALQEYPKSIAIYKQLPDSASKFFNIAQAYVALQDWLNAEHILLRYQKKFPKDVKSYDLLAYVYLKQRPPDPTNAIGQLQAAYDLTKNPKYMELKKIATDKDKEMLEQELEENIKKAKENQ